jgi:hypothetical protein
MDQIIFVIVGTIMTVQYILSPVKFLERIIMLLEKIGGTGEAQVAGDIRKVVRNYYVRGVK